MKERMFEREDMSVTISTGGGEWYTIGDKIVDRR